VRTRPEHVSSFDEPCNTPPHWHCRFHTFNLPQLGFRLKYFIRLARIGIAYCAEAGGKKAEFGKKMRNTKKHSESRAEDSHLFIGTHNETLSVVAVCIDNPDCSPFRNPRS
jgi:hypothetical protein